MARDVHDEPAMSDVEFRMLCDLIRSHCGLHFGKESRYLVERRLGRRLRELELGSFTAYHYLLRQDASGEEELGRIVEELANNETYFFRERNQLRALVEEILPELVSRRAGAGPVSVWCAGCASGEEPYSVVMLALEAGFVPGRDLRVYGSDLSGTMLKKARLGVYRAPSFRQTDPRLRDKYFFEKDGLFRISDELKPHVEFSRVNLLDRETVSRFGPLDVVLCRNVIIYFDLETKRRVIATFAEAIRPAGYLLLGHSETLINLSNAFDLRQLRNDLVYRKPAAGETPFDRWHAAADAALARADGPEFEA